MHPRVKTILQYLVILGITAFLIWYSLSGLVIQNGENKWDYLLQTWKSSHKEWLYAMALLAVLSHIIRAERWRMLIASTGTKTSLRDNFLSLMVGYLVNLVIPRGGEVSRCYNLYKLSRCPVEVSFGTVVVERIVDLLCLIVLLTIAFAVESEKLFAFVGSLPIQTNSLSGKLKLVAVLLIVVAAGGLVFYRFVRKNERLRSFFKKTWQGFREGLLAAFRLERKGLFMLYSLAIWVLYFMMSYTVIQAFDQTSYLGWSAVLALFAIGAIAMAAPLPGGTGSYHALVPAGLVFLYQIPLADAVAFVFVFHGWQTFIMIVGGAISLLISEILLRKASRKEAQKKSDDLADKFDGADVV
jgi:uncharacterized protein (TIRG00374 family)